MLTEKVTARVGSNDFTVLRLPTDTDTFSIITGGRRVMPSYGYLANPRTVMFARSPDNENPGTVYVAKRDPQIIRALRQDKYSRVGRLNNGATIMRRLGGL